MSTNEIILSKDADVRELATRIGKDIGGVDNLVTTDKSSIVASINEVVDNVSTAFEAIDATIGLVYTTVDSTYAKKSELTPLATKAELTQAITDLIDGAGADSDTLKELADKITALAQADNGLVSAEAAQTFDEAQQQQARDNIGAISEADVNDILEAQSGGDYVDDYIQAGL